MLLKQNSCHLDGSSCLLFLVIFLVYLTRGGSGAGDFPAPEGRAAPVFTGFRQKSLTGPGKTWYDFSDLFAEVFPQTEAET